MRVGAVAKARLSTDSAVKSPEGESRLIPAAMKAARLTRCEAGEYAGPVSAERRVFLQKVLGLTGVHIRISFALEIDVILTKRWLRAM